MNDTTLPAASQSAGFTIIKTRLPYLDRRSLSQAWFSALHLAASDAPKSGVASRHPSPVARPVAVARGAAPARTSAPPAPGRMLSLPGRAPSMRLGAQSPAAAAATGRAIRAGATRAASRSYPAFSTSLTFGVEKHRVRLLLRRDGTTLHVVALCRPEVADVVRRALAGADANARRHGDAIRSSVRTLGARPVRA